MHMIWVWTGWGWSCWTHKRSGNERPPRWRYLTIAPRAIVVALSPRVAYRMPYWTYRLRLPASGCACKHMQSLVLYGVLNSVVQGFLTPPLGPAANLPHRKLRYYRARVSSPRSLPQQPDGYQLDIAMCLGNARGLFCASN